MLVFVNYTHSGKKKLEIMLLLFTLSLVKKKKHVVNYYATDK